MSAVKRGHSVRLPLVMHEPYINRESWMLRTSAVKHGCPVCCMRENYVDGYEKLPEEREGDGKQEIYRLISSMEIRR